MPRERSVIMRFTICAISSESALLFLERASSKAAISIASLKSQICETSSSDNENTRAPFWGSILIKPSSRNWASASRTGDFETPSSSDIFRSESIWPIFNVPSIILFLKYSRASSLSDFGLLIGIIYLLKLSIECSMITDITGNTTWYIRYQYLLGVNLNNACRANS